MAPRKEKGQKAKTKKQKGCAKIQQKEFEVKCIMMK